MKHLALISIFLFLSVCTLCAEKLTIAFGSCNKRKLEQPVWSILSKHIKPDLWVWIGDIIYGDTKNMDLLARKYREQYERADYQDFRNNYKIIGIWDDHDYGANNSGKEHSKKKEAQQLLLDFLDEPKDSPRRKQEGVYAVYDQIVGSTRVKIILLDTRYHRDPYGKHSDVLGKAQKAWLNEILSKSKTDIHLIVSSIQVISSEHQWEKWENFPQAKKELFEILRTHKTPNVIFLSGERQIGDISCWKNSPLGYPVWDITSSGLTHSWGERFHGEPNKYRVGNYYPGLNFGLVEIQSKTREIKLELRNMRNQSINSVHLHY
ncbi:MAG: alkaline phosphatase D family protein [Verrucomicrobiota bacterium]